MFLAESYYLTFDNLRMEVDWSNPRDRAEFDRSLKGHKDRQLQWTPIQKTIWVIQIFLVQFLVIAALYGCCAYNLVSYEQALKIRMEEQYKKINQSEEVGGFNITKNILNNQIE